MYYAGNDETNDTIISNEKYFCHGNAHSEWRIGGTASFLHESCIRSARYLWGKFGAKRKKWARNRSIKIFATTSSYRTILCIYSFIIQENSLALTFPPTTVRIINVALKIRYNVRIQYIYTKAHSFVHGYNRRILSVSLSFSLALSLSLSLLSAAKIGTVFFAIFFSRIIVSYLNNKI